MPIRIRLSIDGDNERKEIDIKFPAEGKGAEEILKIFPLGKIYSSGKISVTILKALKIAIEELLTAYSYDETKIENVGGHLLKIVNSEFIYLRDIKNYENRYKVFCSTKEY